MTMIDSGVVFRPNPRVEYRSLAEEGGVLLHLDTASYHGINPVGTLVWNVCADGATFQQIVAAVRSEVVDAPPTLEADLEEFVNSLTQRDLLLADPA